jgi:hypothetical protein
MRNDRRKSMGQIVSEVGFRRKLSQYSSSCLEHACWSIFGTSNPDPRTKTRICISGDLIHLADEDKNFLKNMHLNGNYYHHFEAKDLYWEFLFDFQGIVHMSSSLKVKL